MEKNTAIENLTNKHTELVQAELNIKEAVYAALDAGTSWAQIGEVLGLSKQTTFARHSAGYKAHTATAGAPKFGMETPNISAASVEGSSVTASIFSDEAAPATAYDKAVSIHGKRTVDVFQKFAADQKAAKATVEDQERADFWEAKRKYVVTVDGAIYSPRGEHGWNLHKVLRNEAGRNHQQTYNDMKELIAAYEGLLYISRDKYAGLVLNAATDRECWIMAATKLENTASLRPELAAEVQAMADKLAAIDKKLKAKKAPKA